jgi:hypothetical protein
MFLIPKVLIVIYMAAFFFFLWQTFTTEMKDNE